VRDRDLNRPDDYLRKVDEAAAIADVYERWERFGNLLEWAIDDRRHRENFADYMPIVANRVDQRPHRSQRMVFRNALFVRDIAPHPALRFLSRSQVHSVANAYVLRKTTALISASC